MPRARVDSMKLGHHALVETVTEVVGLAIVFILGEAAVCTLVAPRDPPY